MPGPGVVLWATGREGLAQGVSPESLAAMHPGWCKDARDFGPWQALSRSLCGQSGQCGAGDSDDWWVSRAEAASTTHIPTRIVVCGPCTSVMDVARTFTEAGAEAGPEAGAEAGGLAAWDSVLAVSQRAGRGQLRRRWESPPGNLYACLVLPPAPPEFDSLVPLLLGNCLAEYFAGQGLAMRLKWPNDLLYGGVKVGGLLVEERKGVVSVGIGVNLVSSPPLEALREDHAVPAGHLGQCFTPLALWRSLVDFLRICYEVALDRASPQAVAASVEMKLAWLGEQVTVREGGSAHYRARLMGLAPDGALRVRPMDGTGVEKILTSGSIWPA